MKKTRSAGIPQLMEPLGRSCLGAPILWIPHQPETECDLLVIAGIHGEEPDTTICLSRALRSIESLAPSVAVLLCANPDGHALGTRGNAARVDLNRNFPTSDWQSEPTTCLWYCDEPESEISISTGKSPGSEPETQVILKLVDRVSPKQILALHSPLGCIDDPAQSKLGKRLSRETGLPLVENVGYPTPGSLGTWGAEAGISIVTWEFPREAIEELSKTQGKVLCGLLENPTAE